MPRVFLSSEERAADAARRADEALRVVVATRMMRDGMTQKALADRIGLAPVTLSRRLAKPETFTLGELRRMVAALELSEAETARCV